jgi:AcrR family transcriptional regulator
MAHPKLLSPEEIVRTAMRLVEEGGAEGLSLRAVAAELNVRAPSLYRYFADKEELEVAVAEEILGIMLVKFRTAATTADPHTRFRKVAETYLRFARERFPLYAFVIQDRIARYPSAAGKALWNVMLEASSGVSGQPDDTAAAVATWSFLHGYATLEHSGAFGKSGPKGGLERGIEAFLSNFSGPVNSGAQKKHPARPVVIR